MQSQPYVCECCLSEDQQSLLPLSRVNKTQDGLEVYRDMLLTCFNITIPVYPHGGMICTTCVDRLRDAHRFRKQVLASQSALLTASTHEESKQKDCEVSGDSEASEDDEFKKAKKRKQTLDVFGGVRMFRPQIIKEDVDKLNDAVTELVQTKPAKNASACINVTDREAILFNVKLILSCSNVTPFRGYFAHGYRCFYCNESFKVPQSLREHTAHVHRKEKMSGLITTNGRGWYEPQNFFICLDIKDIACSLCSEAVKGLSELKKHLQGTHSKILMPEIGDKCIPFELDEELFCQCCDQEFLSFRSLLFHMNEHFPNYKCNICGKGFITERRLENHAVSHSEGCYQCNYCAKTFNCKSKLQQHESAVHGTSLRFRCPHCGEKFFTYRMRQQHLIETHNESAKTYKCSICKKKFNELSVYNTHVKKEHWRKRNYICVTCGNTYYTKQDLNKHMVSHTAPQSYQCDTCDKKYSRENSLYEHKRLHHKDQQFICFVCAKSFVVEANLIKHLKRMHPLNEHQLLLDEEI